MCQACTLWELGKLTSKEVDKALTELIDDRSSDEDLIHYQELIEKVKNET